MELVFNWKSFFRTCQCNVDFFYGFIYEFYPKDQQTKATSSIIVANNLGMLLGFITSTLLYEKIGMQMICLLSVISGIISALFISLLPKEKT